MESLNPTHGIPFQLPDGIRAGLYGQVRNELPVDPLSILGCTPFLGVQHSKVQLRVLFLFSNGRKNPNATIADLQNGFRDFSFFIPAPEAMHALDMYFIHFVCNRMIPVAGQPATQVRSRKCVPACCAIQNSS
jgi:hypothetical protein